MTVYSLGETGNKKILLSSKEKQNIYLPGWKQTNAGQAFLTVRICEKLSREVVDLNLLVFPD